MLDLPPDDGLEARWGRLLEVREPVLKALEVARGEGRLGNSLEARVTIETSGERLALLRRYAPTLADLFIVSEVILRDVAASASPGQGRDSLSLKVDRSEGSKCERCWHVTRDVGLNPEFRTLCARCVGAVAEILRTRGAGV